MNSQVRSAPGVTTRTARALVAPTPAIARGQDIARRLEEGIRLGVIEAGTRLPSEAALAEQFNVSPITLREALALLRDSNLVSTRRGRGGGTFVLAPVGRPGDYLEGVLASQSQQQIQDLGDHRAAITVAASRLAAERALPSDVAELADLATRLDLAAPVSALRRADAHLHVAIAAAAQSPRLAHEEMTLWAQIGDLAWFATPPEDRDAVVREHHVLIAAIDAGDIDRAGDVARRHVDDETRRIQRLHMQLPASSA